MMISRQTTWSLLLILVSCALLNVACLPNPKELMFETAAGRTKSFEIRTSSGNVVAICRAWKRPSFEEDNLFHLSVRVDLFTENETTPTSFDPNTLGAWFNDVMMVPGPNWSSGKARVLDNGAVSTSWSFRIQTNQEVLGCSRPGKKIKREIKIYIGDLLKLNGLKSDADTLRIIREFKCPE